MTATKTEGDDAPTYSRLAQFLRLLKLILKVLTLFVTLLNGRVA